MAFKPVAAQPQTFSGPEAVEAELREALPNHPDAYYSDLTERIIHTAVAGGYQMASVVDAYIIGALNRGEGQ